MLKPGKMLGHPLPGPTVPLPDDLAVTLNRAPTAFGATGNGACGWGDTACDCQLTNYHLG